MKVKSSMLAITAVILFIFFTSIPVFAAPEGEITLALPYAGFLAPNPLKEDAHAHDYLSFLYDRIVGLNPDGSLSRETGIAKNWKMTPDGLKWTINLRKGAKFYDGTELTAKDVKFTLEMSMGPTCRSPFRKKHSETIKSIEIIDPYTLVINCNKPFYSLPYDYSSKDGFILPKDYYEKVGEDTFTKKPMGSGPYKLHSVMTGSHIKFEARENHWRDGVPRYKYVNFRIIPEESTRVAMLMTGETDIAIISRDRVKEVTDSGLKLVYKRNAALLTFNPCMQWTSPAFSDIRFRKALNLAIDKEAIMKHIFGGQATPAITWPGSVIKVAGEVSDLKPYPYKPDEAKRLIKEAGFEGYQFEVPSYKRSDCPEFQRVVETVCGYWEKLGLKPKISVMEWSSFQSKWRAGKAQGMIYGVTGSTDPNLPMILRGMRTYSHSSSKRSFAHDPKLDTFIDRAQETLDPDELDQIVLDVYRYYYDQYHYIPICEFDEIIATTKRIPGWDPGRLRVERNYLDLIRQK